MILTARRAILIDAAATATSAVLLLAARSMLYPYFGLNSPLLIDITAAAFLAYAAIIAAVARREAIARATLLTIASANVAYVVASIMLLVMIWGQLHLVGRTLIFAAAMVVEAFATLQFVAARQAPQTLRSTPASSGY
jgi:hypothetical protein